MDPLTLANTFATIVQLVGMYKQESKEAKEADAQNFIAWLDYHHHEEIKNLICTTAALQTEVVTLLRQDSAVMLSKLDSINATLCTLLSQVEGFRGLSKILLPSTELSDQAVSILWQLVASNARTFAFDEDSPQAFFESTGNLLLISEPLFVSDDINILVSCGLISQQESGSERFRIYGITRAGAKYIKAINNDVDRPPKNPIDRPEPI